MQIRQSGRPETGWESRNRQTRKHLETRNQENARSSQTFTILSPEQRENSGLNQGRSIYDRCNNNKGKTWVRVKHEGNYLGRSAPQRLKWALQPQIVTLWNSLLNL